MKLYNYDDNGVFTGVSTARLDPLESTEKKPVYLIPRNATKTPAPEEDGKIGVFDGSKWSLVEDHRGEEAYDTDGEPVTVDKVGSLVDLGLTDTAPPEPPADPRQVRDAALAALVHDFGDGRVIQCRPHPYSDESNMRNAIEQMGRLGQSERLWFAADNTGATVTPADLQTAIESGQDQSAIVWATFFADIGG